MSEKLWVKLAMDFYGKDYETSERMGRANYFNRAAAKMIRVVAEDVDGEESQYLEEQAVIAESEERL